MSDTPLNKTILQVIFRSHADSNYRPGMRRVTDTLGGKEELLIRSLRSLCRSLALLDKQQITTIRLAVLDDHSNARCIQRIEQELSQSEFETKLVHLSEKGNAPSMRSALEYGRDCEADFVYFVEDDYLHEESAMVEMVESFKTFTTNFGHNNVGLTPVDYSDYYLPHNLVPSRVVPGSHRHWRVSYTTTSTFFLHQSLLKSQWEWFIKNPESEYSSPEGMTEKGSLNVVWQEKAMLFSPIKKLAYHVHGPQEMPPFTNWRRLWDSLDHEA